MTIMKTGSWLIQASALNMETEYHGSEAMFRGARPLHGGKG